MEADVKKKFEDVFAEIGKLQLEIEKLSNKKSYFGGVELGKKVNPITEPAKKPVKIVGLIKPSNFFPSGQNPYTAKGWQSQAEYDAYLVYESSNG